MSRVIREMEQVWVDVFDMELYPRVKTAALPHNGTDQKDCHTFTVKTQARLGHRDFNCYFHKAYKCQKKNNQYAGIDNYVKREDIRNAKYDDLGVWGGICRTSIGNTWNYACSKTPHP